MRPSVCQVAKSTLLGNNGKLSAKQNTCQMFNGIADAQVNMGDRVDGRSTASVGLSR